MLRTNARSSGLTMIVFDDTGIPRLKPIVGLTIVFDDTGIARLNARSSGLGLFGASAGSVPR